MPSNGRRAGSTGAIGLFLGLKFASFFITYKWILVLLLLVSSVFLVYAYNKINKDDLWFFEENMILESIRKHKKHYLNPNAKAFIHKFLKNKR